jgi:beta-lactamase class A
MRRHFMDFDARARGVDNTTSARDMGVLALGIANGRSLGYAGASAASCRRITRYMLAQEDRESIPAGIARDVKIANKTGELQDVRHDVAIVDLDGANPYVVALLSANLTHRSAAFARLRELAANIDRVEPKAAPAAPST